MTAAMLCLMFMMIGGGLIVKYQFSSSRVAHWPGRPGRITARDDPAGGDEEVSNLELPNVTFSEQNFGSSLISAREPYDYLGSDFMNNSDVQRCLQRDARFCQAADARRNGVRLCGRNLTRDTRVSNAPKARLASGGRSCQRPFHGFLWTSEQCLENPSAQAELTSELVAARASAG